MITKDTICPIQSNGRSYTKCSSKCEWFESTSNNTSGYCKIHDIDNGDYHVQELLSGIIRCLHGIASSIDNIDKSY